MALSCWRLCLLLPVIFISVLPHGLGQDLEVSTSQTVAISEQVNATFRFFPWEIEGLVVDETADVNFTVELSVAHSVGSPATAPATDLLGFVLRIEVLHQEIAEVAGESDFTIFLNHSGPLNYSLTVKGKFLGRSQLLFLHRTLGLEVRDTVTVTGTGGEHSVGSSPFHNETSSWQETNLFYKVAVIREERIIDVLFIACVSILVIISNIGMGCKIDLKVVKEVLRRPVSPVIGFCCQFLVMPTLAFSLTKALKLSGGQGLGFFATGCAPGGGASNVYTFMFNADVSLSVTMTLVSVITAFGMVPLWLLTLGQRILDESQGDIVIPFENILISLASIIIPVGIGLLIQKKRPAWAKKVVKSLTPFFVFFILFMFTAGVYSNLYLFRLFTPDLVAASVLLPYVGFITGGILAVVFRQPRSRILAIAIETGIQNTGIPIILLKYSLPQPEADLSVVAPVMVAIFTPIPLWIALAVLEIRKRRCQKRSEFEGVNTEEQDKLKQDMNSNSSDSGKAEEKECAGMAEEHDGKDREMTTRTLPANGTEAVNVTATV